MSSTPQSSSTGLPGSLYRTGLKIYSCKWSGCPERFESQDELQDHWREDHPKCPHCQSKMKGYEELDLHLERWHPKCDECTKRFRTRDLLDLHCEDGIPCDICSKCIGHCTQKSLDKHKQETHWQCPECLRFFASESLRNMHIDEKHLTCSRCSHRFSTKEEYVNHRQDPRKCLLCTGNPTWCNKTLLCKHLEQKHVQCRECKWYWFDSEALSIHVVDPKVKCSACQAHFAIPSMLDIHMKESHIKCTECDRYCFDQRELSKHVADPMLRCSSCQKHYREQRMLAHHLKDSFRCNLCTGDDIWICRRSAASLDDHRRDKHVKCLKCSEEKYFRDKEAYRSHVSKIHSNKSSGTRHR